VKGILRQIHFITIARILELSVALTVIIVANAAVIIIPTCFIAKTIVAISAITIQADIHALDFHPIRRRKKRTTLLRISGICVRVLKMIF